MNGDDDVLTDEATDAALAAHAAGQRTDHDLNQRRLRCRLAAVRAGNWWGAPWLTITPDDVWDRADPDADVEQELIDLTEDADLTDVAVRDHIEDLARRCMRTWDEVVVRLDKLRIYRAAWAARYPDGGPPPMPPPPF